MSDKERIEKIKNNRQLKSLFIKYIQLSLAQKAMYESCQTTELNHTSETKGQLSSFQAKKRFLLSTQFRLAQQTLHRALSVIYGKGNYDEIISQITSWYITEFGEEVLKAIK